jgi:hypothetical protein
MSEDVQLSKEDAHARVAVTFMLEKVPENETPVMLAFSIKWILTHGYPVHPQTGLKMIYDGTHIIQ